MAVFFSGSGDTYIRGPLGTSALGDIALSTWVTGGLGVNAGRPINLSSGYSGGGVGFYTKTFATSWEVITNGTVDGLYTIPVNNNDKSWKHIYLVWSAGVLAFAAVNGKKVPITTVTPLDTVTNTWMDKASIGGAASVSGIGGGMEEFAIWRGAVGTEFFRSPSVFEALAKGASPPTVVPGRPIFYASLNRVAIDTGMDSSSAIAGTPRLMPNGPTSARRKLSPRFLSLVHTTSGPLVSSLGTKLEAGQALVINGGGFGTETGDAAVTISPANDIADAGAVVQTPTAWADGQITVASPTLTGMADGDTVYVFVTDSAGTDSAGQSVQIADMVLRVGPPVATDDILDIDTGIAIASESLTKVAVMTTNLETVVAAYTDAVITAGKFEYDDSSVANITTEDDEFVVVMNGGTSRLGALRATVVDRNED